MILTQAACRSTAAGVRLRFGVVTLAFVLALSSAATAQNLSSASIDGTVSDETGGSLPGVTVTAASPALQVKQLTRVTDSAGHYRFADLPRGTYQLRFELSGFKSVIRESLALSVGFAARVDMTMGVGTLEETVTVEGGSPVVDLSTTRGGQTVSTDLLLTTLPGNKTMADLINMTPGLSNTAGESPGFMGLQGRPRWNMHGINSTNTNSAVMIDGFLVPTNNPVPDVGATEEVDLKTFGNGAEVKEPGVAINMILKSGGNDFHGTVGESFMRQPSSNLDDALRARGLTIGQDLKYYNDVGGTLGGRIVRDKLWFFGSARIRHNQVSQAGLVLNAGPDGKYLTGDEPPAYPKQSMRNAAMKLSYQMTSKYQLIGYVTRDRSFSEAELQIAPFGAAVNFASTVWEATNPFDWKNVIWKGQARGTPNSNLLFDVQFGRTNYVLDWGIQPEAIGTPPMYDRTTLLLTGSNMPHESLTIMWVGTGNLSYYPTSFLGGRHAFKVGYDLSRRGKAGGNLLSNPAGEYSLLFENGVPAELETNNAPVDPDDWDDVYSLYLTDQWKLGGRLTFNLGMRWDLQHSYVPEQTREAGQFAPAQTFPRIDVLTYQHLAPRVAAAWDPTGSGRTVIKGTYGWFNVQEGLARDFNPNARADTRYRWRDLNGNKRYDPGEVNFDTSSSGPDILSATIPRNNILNPDLKLSHVQEYTASVQHELAPNVALRGLYLYRRFGDQFASVNVLRPYSAFNIPLTRRDPGPDGVVGNADDGALVTIYDYDLAFRGNSFIGNKNLKRPAGRDDYYQSIEIALDKRSSNRWSLQSGYTATKFHRWIVGFPQSPNDEDFPLDTKWRWQFKLNGSYTLPHDIEVGTIVEVLSGFLGQRTYTFRATDPLGGAPLRQLSSVTLRLEPFGSQRESAQPVLNLRLGKTFRRGIQRLQFSLDVLNALNTNAIKSASYVSGPRFGTITGSGGGGAPGLVAPRQLRIGALYQF